MNGTRQQVRTRRPLAIWVEGAMLHNSNMGLSALADSCICGVVTRFPEANLTVASRIANQPDAIVSVDGQERGVKQRCVWLSQNPLSLYSSFGLRLRYAARGLVPVRPLSDDDPLPELSRMQLVLDITGGDSFSDIYGGLDGLVRHRQRKAFLMSFKKPFVMLPQTYGPFSTPEAKRIARWVLERTALAMSRDHEGLDVLRDLMGDEYVQQKAVYVPDLAYTLEPSPAPPAVWEQIALLRSSGRPVVGLNVSGLLYNNAYDWRERLGLAVDYRELMQRLVGVIASEWGAGVLLVPHVLAKQGKESDPSACRILREASGLSDDRVAVLAEPINHRQLKGAIGQCDFFVGSRMHSCIAALSQGVPTMGIAYSCKFSGVFESVGASDCVADLRTSSIPDVLNQVESAYNSRTDLRRRLEAAVPVVQRAVREAFDLLVPLVGQP